MKYLINKHLRLKLPYIHNKLEKALIEFPEPNLCQKYI
jgi:hypothetical protein